jgi:hypothetical protein
MLSHIVSIQGQKCFTMLGMVVCQHWFRRHSCGSIIPDHIGRVVVVSFRSFISKLRLLLLFSSLIATGAANAENRIALVVGNAAYQSGPLNTAANDAGLIAQTLQAAGFDVVGARDLDQDTLRRSFHDFLEKATGSGIKQAA